MAATLGRADRPWNGGPLIRSTKPTMRHRCRDRRAPAPGQSRELGDGVRIGDMWVERDNHLEPLVRRLTGHTLRDRGTAIGRDRVWRSVRHCVSRRLVSLTARVSRPPEVPARHDRWALGPVGIAHVRKMDNRHPHIPIGPFARGQSVIRTAVCTHGSPPRGAPQHTGEVPDHRTGATPPSDRARRHLRTRGGLEWRTCDARRRW